MSNENVEITQSIGRTLKDRLRAIEWEPLPKRLSEKALGGVSAGNQGQSVRFQKSELEYREQPGSGLEIGHYAFS
jgi:hypothetical protein